MDVPTIVNAALQIFLALVGFPATLAAVIAIAEKLGLSTATAQTVSLVANLVAFIAIGYLVITGQGALAAVIDASLVGVAKLLADIVVILGTVGAFAISYRSTASHVRALRAVNLKY